MASSRAFADGSSSWLANTAWTPQSRASAGISPKRHAVAHDQLAARVAQGLVEFDDARVNERHATIVSRQRREDFAVENERAQDLAAACERVIECSMVCDAQVAPKPDQPQIKVGHQAAPLVKSRIMSKTSDRINLTNQFLIAMPNMADPTFSGTVVYLCEHSERGALGLVINKPTDIDLQSLFDRIDLKLEIEPLVHLPVYFGGPVQTERGFVLHEAGDGEPYTSSMKVPGGLEMTTSKDVLEAVASGKGPERFLVTLGQRAGAQASSKRKSRRTAGSPSKPSRASSSTCPSKSASKRRCRCSASRSMLSGEAGHA